MPLKLITYNIFHGKYLDRVIDFLKTEKPDVLCLQEAATSGLGLAANDMNMFEEIKTRLDMSGEYRRMCWGEKDSGKYDIGVAILSRVPVTGWIDFRYERDVTKKVLEPSLEDRYNLPRVLLGAKIDLNGVEQWVFNTHFTITPDAQSNSHQLTQAHRVKQFLADYPDTILCGDLNTAYQTETYRILSEGMIDVSLGEIPTLHPTIHPVGYLNHHVDYVFLPPKGVNHISTRVPVVDGSDHLPIVVELELQ